MHVHVAYLNIDYLLSNHMNDLSPESDKTSRPGRNWNLSDEEFEMVMESKI